MSEFVQGQRWVVDSEPELGLGIVVEVDTRSVSIFFPAGDCERRYAQAQAPLTRVTFHADENINTLDGGEYLVRTVHDQGGLLVYELENGDFIPETQLSPEIQLNQPLMRLMMGQLDKASWFYFRRTLDAAMTNVWNARLNGLLGVRANLIPHQLYVANSACNCDKVRVLLADEVGLGKTIEAGLILSRLLKQHRVSRILIVVPDALVVQWLVELIRRFNIHPVVYSADAHNFEENQMHLMPHSAFVSAHEALQNSTFDIVVVDEAHNLKSDSPEFAVLKILAAASPHLILMTATPEQLGFESHFSRLQLLDPAKYDSPEKLRKEERRYEHLNALVKQLPESREVLTSEFNLDAGLNDDELLVQALDYHGVGRVMFRNSRLAVSGFPKRVVNAHEIESADWQTRYEWLALKLKKQSEEKVLVITHEKEQVLECESYLWKKHGIDAAVFHEDMSLIERDRAAAYFADMDQGARVLLCSEIGSEGRNFQFSRQLVCLDLPEHPDVFEQRIGRLDRIGQKYDVEVHALISSEDDSASRWRWFHNTLNCVEQQNSAAAAVHDELWPGDFLSIDSELEKRAKARAEQLEEEIRVGRDALLELNSCREPEASELAKQIADFEQHTPKDLVELASDLLNFHFEELGSGRYSLIPADNMLVPVLPGIPAEGVELTFDRELANSREDLLFISWDAPFIVGLWELLHHSELGSACVAMLPTRQLAAGQCLLEACFDIVIQSEFSADCLPFLSTFSIRTLSLASGSQDLAAALPEQKLEQTLQKVDKKIARQIVKSKKRELPEWFVAAEKISSTKKETILADAKKQVEKHFLYEKQRLDTFAARSNDIDASEIQQLEEKRSGILAALSQCSHLQLSALRLIVTNSP